jgi:hypothetical protein
MSLSAFRRPPIRRIALALAAAVLFGWPGKPNAAAIHYTFTNATATFSTIPNPPPTPPVVDTITGSFDFDAATLTESNVILILTDGVDPGGYATVLPTHTDGSTINASVFGVAVSVQFTQPLDGTSTVDPISKVLITAFAPNPCENGRGALCSSSQVSGSATTLLVSPPPIATPEPTSFAVFGPASVLCVILCWANRRRMTRRSPGTA